MRIRPKCRRCGKPLNISGDWSDDLNKWVVGFDCGFPESDEEFWRRWDNLDGDDVVRLERFLDEYTKRLQT